MATIKSFEEIIAWQRARVFSKRIYALSVKGTFSKDYSLKDQINASSGSIMDNIAEGFGRGGTKEFILFLSYARGSADESCSQLYRAFDRNHISEELFNELKEEAAEIGKMITGFMIYLQNSGIKGSKFLKPQEPHISDDLENYRL
jgi:four helix bundle protein